MHRSKSKEQTISLTTMRSKSHASSLDSSAVLYESFPLSAKQVRDIFDAKCEDIGLKPSEKSFSRFEKNILSKSFHKVFSMETSTLGPKCAKVIRRILFDSRKFSVLLLSGNSFGDEGAKELSDVIKYLPNLIYVDLSANLIEDEGMEAIFDAMRRNKNIYSFAIGSKTGVNRNNIGTRASRSLSAMLADNSILTELDLSMIEITPENIRVIGLGLARNKILRDLNLSNNNIQSKGMINLVPNLVRSQLQTVKLNGNHLQDDCGPMFATFIRDNVTIQSVDISNNLFTAKFINTIQNALCKCETIKELNLSKNPLTGRGASHFNKILQYNNTLTVLSLQACKIDVNGVAQLAEGLAMNTSLQSLSLSNNPLRDDGICKLAAALKEQKGLKKLYLDLTEMSDRGCKALCDALTPSKTITTLSVKNNLIKDGEPIHQFTQQNPYIKKLFIEFNDISLAYIGQIQKTMQENKAKAEAEKHAKMVVGSQSMTELEMELNETRAMIKLQRDTLEMLKYQLVSTKEESEKSKMSQIRTISQLEIRDKGVDRALHQKRTVERNKMDEIEGQVSIEKQTVEQMENRINSEVERYKTDISMISSLEKQEGKIKEEHEQQMKDLEIRKKEMRQYYKDAVDILIDAFKKSKEPPQPEKPEGEEQQEDDESEEKKQEDGEGGEKTEKTESKKGKGKKGKKGSKKKSKKTE